MMARFSYEIKGQDVNGVDWAYEGTADVPVFEGFPGVAMQATQNVFKQLTEGKAVFGKPGVGCKGPYKITEFHAKLLEN